MIDYVISTDAAGDLTPDYAKDHHILIIPIFYQMDGVVYGKDSLLDEKVFYQKMREGLMPTTSALNPTDVHDYWEPFLKAGKDILHFSFSSALSSSCQTVMLCARELMEKYPERKIRVIDTLEAAFGHGLVVDYACFMRDHSYTLEETGDWIEEHLPNFVAHFTVNDLFHLHRGGRVSKTAAIVGTVINIKPVLYISDLGTLLVQDKVRGRKKALMTLVDHMEKLYKKDPLGLEHIFISHSDCLEDAQFVAGEVEKRLGKKVDQIVYMSPIIGTHTGPGTVALFYYGTSRV